MFKLNLIALLLLLLDDLSSGIKVERELHGYKLNCSVVYRGRHRPEVSWMSALRTTVRFLRSSLVNKATHHVVSSEIFISSNDEYTLPAFCQVSVPLFRCNELSSMNTLKFPVHPIHSNGQYTSLVIVMISVSHLWHLLLREHLCSPLVACVDTTVTQVRVDDVHYVARI